MRYLSLLLGIILSFVKAKPDTLSDALKATEASGGSQEQKILTNLLANYDMRVRPPPTNVSEASGPVITKVNIMMRMLSKIDVVNMEYSMQITFREQWIDRRLAYEHHGYSHAPDFLTVPHVKDRIWIPDTFFPMEKHAHRHMIDTENLLVRIYKDGRVLYSVRLSLTLSCPMRLQLYPLDVQYCNFDLISYAHTTKDIVYEWMEGGQPVQIKAGVGSDLPNFSLVNVNTNHSCTSNTTTGAYSCLRMQLKLARQLVYHVTTCYIPTTMIVIVSWVSFWIDMHSTAGRVALGVTTLLTMTTLQSSINSKLPPVSYVKVIDVWLGACQTFVFGALIEYAFVAYQDDKRTKKKAKEEQLRRAQKRHKDRADWVDSEVYQPPCTCSKIVEFDILNRMPRRRPLWERIKKVFSKPDYVPAQIDFYSRFICPVGFIVFNCVYWTCCYIMMQHYREEMERIEAPK